MSVLLLVAVLASQPKAYEAEFVGCYDGDTCTFHIVTETETSTVGFGVEHVSLIRHLHQRVRMCDIQAPEIRPLATRKEATRVRNILISWIKGARRVQLLVPQDPMCRYPGVCDMRGKFGRLLAYVMADGVNLNDKLVEEGHVGKFPARCPR